ncbi:MAG TPA: hypothetical protein VKZ66_10615 [Pusillimonas sp.]|uniref:hypothetical protein n=1 Tax=unclassified Pusillimonas TaxID=2640016 RepID=UPI002634C983|nr:MULTISPECIES: hypothetical protein [unclassified Pusillimonas]HLU20399.1 hypothetical protein [Pusillimonas sp.]
MHKTNSSIAIKLAAIAAAVSLSGVALAQPSTATPAGPAVEQSGQSPDAKRHSHRSHKHGHMHRHHFQKAALVVPGYGALSEKAVETLKLNEAQVKLVEEAREAQKAQRKNHFASLKEQRAERLQALKDGKLDPKAALEQSQEKRKAMLDQHDKTAAKWLAVWDSLDDGQRKQVAQQFAEKAEKRAERIKKHAERRAGQEKTQEAAS